MAVEDTEPVGSRVVSFIEFLAHLDRAEDEQRRTHQCEGQADQHGHDAPDRQQRQDETGEKGDADGLRRLFARKLLRSATEVFDGVFPIAAAGGWTVGSGRFGGFRHGAVSWKNRGLTTADAGGGPGSPSPAHFGPLFLRGPQR